MSQKGMPSCKICTTISLLFFSLVNLYLTYLHGHVSYQKSRVLIFDPSVETKSSPTGKSTPGGHCEYLYSRMLKKAEKQTVNVTSLYPDTFKNFKQNSLYVHVVTYGRLGNNLFQYAALLGVAARNKRIPVMSTVGVSLLKKCFNNFPVQDTIARSADSKWLVMPQKTVYEYMNKTEKLPNRNVTIETYLQSRLYFSRYEENLRKTLEFQPLIMRRVDAFLLNTRPHSRRNDRPCRVLIHIRLTDYREAGPSRGYANFSLAEDQQYIQRAMEYFRNCYNNVQFFVASDDMATARKIAYGPGVIYSNGMSACEHLALASRCDHAIITVGSFGIWSAWFADGVTVIRKNLINPNNKFGQDLMNDMHYFPQGTVEV